MKTVELDDHVYRSLQGAKREGETDSDTVRRLLLVNTMTFRLYESYEKTLQEIKERRS